MKKLYEIDGYERPLDTIKRYASLGREFVAYGSDVRVIDGESKNVLSTVISCKRLGTCGAVEMANYFAKLLQAIANETLNPASTELMTPDELIAEFMADEPFFGKADVSPDRDILAEMTPDRVMHVGVDLSGGTETTVESMHYADGRIHITDIKVKKHE